MTIRIRSTMEAMVKLRKELERQVLLMLLTNSLLMKLGLISLIWKIYRY
jgi:hypothetical protein